MQNSTCEILNTAFSKLIADDTDDVEYIELAPGFGTTLQGAPLLFDARYYSYTQNGKSLNYTRNNKIHWRCSVSAREKCTARLIAMGNKIIVKRNEHTHSPLERQGDIKIVAKFRKDPEKEEEFKQLAAEISEKKKRAAEGRPKKWLKEPLEEEDYVELAAAFSKTKKGYPLLIDERKFTYIKNGRSKRSNHTYWKCQVYRTKGCPANLVSAGAKILSISGEHNHPVPRKWIDYE